MQSSYCPSPYRYTRRVTREVMVGNVGVGGSNPIRIQSMLTSDTRDTDACVKEALELAEAGCEIIRLTAQTKAYAANLENIARELRAAGCHVPLVADIHFKPDAAMEAAKWVEKIRINPGNFVDKKKFEVREYSDAEYREELDRLRAHVAAARDLIAEGGAVGRKLDFLVQEMNREANTLGSKAMAADMTAIAVELKLAIEQMREQVQNIE